MTHTLTVTRRVFPARVEPREHWTCTCGRWRYIGTDEHRAWLLWDTHRDEKEAS